MTEQEIQHIRADFPILRRKFMANNSFISDNAATTQKPQAVLDRINFGYKHLNANIHRGVHYLSQKPLKHTKKPAAT